MKSDSLSSNYRNNGSSVPYDLSDGIKYENEIKGSSCLILSCPSDIFRIDILDPVTYI